MSASLKWVANRKIELAIFLFGVLLRLSMAWNYHFSWNYDSDLHWEVITWILKHKTVPATESVFESFHPPLYYLTAAWLVEHGLTRATLVSFSIACGVIRLGIIWAGLELYMVGSRWGRIAALGLAAVVSASVHLDGMVYTEPMSCLLCAFAMLLVPLVFRRPAKYRWPLAIVLGATLGLAFLTKVSAIVVIGAIGLATAVELLIARKPLQRRVVNALPWVGMLVVVVGICGWYYGQNIRLYGTPIVTSFNLPSQSWLVTEAVKKPVIDRRSIGFILGWNDDVYKSPYRPSGLGPAPRFFPVAIASSVVDYWGYGFAGLEDPKPGNPPRGMKPIAQVRQESRLAMIGGTVIFFAMVCAWLGSMVYVIRRRDMGRLALLLVPALMMLAALQFAVAYPIDDYGVTKGVYMTFAAPPLYALFGVAVGWAQRRPIRWPVLGMLTVALLFVAWYSIVCRLGMRLPL